MILSSSNIVGSLESKTHKKDGKKIGTLLSRALTWTSYKYNKEQRGRGTPKKSYVHG